ncbi:conjugal transfer protein, partial [Bacillus sp. 7520-S]
MLENFPLFCQKCKKKNLINVQQLNMSVIKEPDAKT